MTHPFILRKPVITEKSMANTALGIYTFHVDPQASKGQIKAAIEDAFDVDVLSVKTARVAGKTRRTGRLRKKLLTSPTKKAYVKIKAGQKIAVFETQ